MGFLKFLKKEKKKEGLDELDLPPAPPPLEGFDEDFSSIPEIPEISGKQAEELPEFDFSGEDFQGLEDKESMKGFPDFPAEEEKPVSIPAISAPMPATIPQVPEFDARKFPKPQMPKDSHGFLPEGKSSRVPMGSSLYVRVEKFKVALGSINVVRNDLRKTEEALIKLEEIKSMEEKAMNKIKSSLDDLQKKFVFVDKTLFEGD